MRKLLWRAALLIAAGLVGCSVEVAQTIDATPFPTSAPPGTSSNATPAPNLSGSFVPTPLAPLELTGYDFSGRVIITHGQAGVIQYDMVSGAVEKLFEPPENGLVTAAAVAPEGGQIAMSYSPPPGEGEIQLGYTGLYILAGDGSGSPQVFLEGSQSDVYFGPAWSPDGRYLYYGHFEAERADGSSSGISLERITYPDGQAEVLLDDALWPALSPDGAKLAYISIDLENFLDELFIADADGSNPQPALEKGLFPAVDAPRFTRDSQTVIFSAVTQEAPSTSGRGLLADFPGVRVAKAHAVPSDLFTVGVEGGDPTRLTELGGIGMNAAYAPDGQSIAFVTTEGLHVMKSDGSEPSWLLDLPGLITLEWVR